MYHSCSFTLATASCSRVQLNLCLKACIESLFYYVTFLRPQTLGIPNQDTFLLASYIV